MKLLKEGKATSKEVECTGEGNGNDGCGALLLLEEGDLFFTYSHVKDETDRFISFRCLYCGVLNDVTGIPHWYQSIIRIKEKE
jgi:hypothetical protein